MNGKDFINNLTYKNADYNNPELAITTANLCETISRDINTDNKRFIYELLQNADDASNSSCKLDVQINFADEFVVISHNGDAFSNIDIKSISSAGDGTKSGDNKKTGFKGIGFKSVFSEDKLVIIKSGDFCFKFDKQHWKDYWNDAWGPKNSWQTERKSENKDEHLKMPWQIIPIWTELPDKLKHLHVLQEYKVSTIIKYNTIEKLKNDLDDLFSKSQIVLFLRSKEVKIAINTPIKLTLEKNIFDGQTILKRNGKTLSEWLIKTEKFEIPSDVRIEINVDEKSPRKLKEAEQTEISFAIQLEKDRLRAVDKENRLIFTYLPTSINYDFPFLVNASFLTDAGRQHLHQDAFWNNWLFKQIPIIFFNWVAELAHKDSKYNKQFLSVIPHKLGGSLLESSFNEGFKIAINTISFIPNLNGDLLKIKDTLYDKTNISDFITPQPLINYINFSKNKQFTASSLIPYLEPISTLSKLGAEFFDLDDLEGFFASNFFVNEHKLEENFKLISFLHEQVQRNKSDEDKKIWNEKLKRITFIFDENTILKKPNHIYFPAIEFTNEFTDEISIIHESVVSKINTNTRIKSWLEYLGVKEPSDVSFIEKTIIEQSDTFVTTHNAIDVGRYLFNAHKKGILLEHHYESLRHLQILTKESSLINASSSFLSDFYEPVLKIENTYKNNFYTSEDYVIDLTTKKEWSNFFIKIGVAENIELKKIELSNLNAKKIYNDFLPFFEKNATQKYTSNAGDIWYNHIYQYNITIYSLIEFSTEYTFSKLFWEKVIMSTFSRITNDRGYANYQNNTNLEENFLDWCFKNAGIFPTNQKKCLKANEIFINDKGIAEITGKYLPVFDCNEILSPAWREILNFNERLTFDNYLEILSKIWQDLDLPENEQVENKKRIGLIYEKLAQIDLHQSDKDKINEWSNVNKLLSKNGKDFYYPHELSIVTVGGFNASNIIFVEKLNSEIIELLRLFGVKIIDKVIPAISNSKVEIKDFKTKIFQIMPLIALVAVEKSKNKKEWEIEFERIKNKLTNIQFFETEEIYLSYGNEEDKQKRSSWAENDNFYYVGKWFSPRVLDGLIEPLGAFFNIRYAERILTVLLLENFAGGLEYLKEKGYDVSLIPNELMNSEEQEINIPNQLNREYNQSDEDLGKQGEIFVFKELKRIYYAKYNQPIEETSTGFKIDNKVEVFWQNISSNTTKNHDFKVIDLDKEIFIDSKATPYDKNVEKLALYISGNELSLMEIADKYLIARVYNATSVNPKMELVKLGMDDLTK